MLALAGRTPILSKVSPKAGVQAVARRAIYSASFFNVTSALGVSLAGAATDVSRGVHHDLGSNRCLRTVVRGHGLAHPAMM